jgi:hypothetical protein
MPLSFVFMIPQFSEEAVDDWIAMTVEADILLVPGIGPDEARLLAVEDPTHGAVTNTFELLGKWLSFHRGAEPPSSEWASDFFVQWLEAKGIDAAHRRDIGNAVHSRLDSWMPALLE